MSSGFWKRASASLTVGALTALLASPLASLASPAEQGGGFGQCLTLGSGGLQGAGTQSIGLGQVYTLGAGGFYGPSYSPVYSGYGLGTVSGFENFSGGQPSRLATLAGSPYCQGLGLTVPAPTGAPYVVRDFGTTPNSTLGYVGAGYGYLGQTQQQFGMTGFHGGYGGFYPPPFGYGSPWGSPFGFGGYIPR